MAGLVIPNAPHARYDATTQRTKAEGMVQADINELERRLDAGEWLTPGEVAKLLGVGRTTMHELLGRNAIRFTTKPLSRHRICNPADVRRELDTIRKAKAAAEGDEPEA